jgi:predicted transcriptional regulator YdeE
MTEAANPTKLQVEPFLVIGIGARTTNQREMSGQGTIEGLWGRLIKDKLLERIPNRGDDRIVAVYSDYENDRDGEYSYLLGAKVRTAEEVPDGMISRQVGPGEYAMFRAKGGPVVEMVVGIWKKIWALETDQKLERAYRTDFEVYSPDALVDIYVGLLALG